MVNEIKSAPSRHSKQIYVDSNAQRSNDADRRFTVLDKSLNFVDDQGNVGIGAGIGDIPDRATEAFVQLSLIDLVLRERAHLDLAFDVIGKQLTHSDFVYNCITNA